MTPHVPIEPQEIIDEVLQAAEMGICIAHLHARQGNGEPTWRKDVYRRIIRGIRKVNRELILCVSTSGRNFPEFQKRADVLDLEEPFKPDMASLTLGSLNFSGTASMNAPQMIRALLEKMNERGIKPELEVFDLGMVNYARYLIRKNLLRPPYYFNILLGNISTAQADLPVIGEILRQLPPSSVWALAGIGDCQAFVTSLSTLLGGHVRIGLEDNIYFDPQRTTLATNSMLVKRVVDVAAAMGLPLARPDQVREMLGLTAVAEEATAAADRPAIPQILSANPTRALSSPPPAA